MSTLFSIFKKERLKNCYFYYYNLIISQLKKLCLVSGKTLFTFVFALQSICPEFNLHHRMASLSASRLSTVGHPAFPNMSNTTSWGPSHPSQLPKYLQEFTPSSLKHFLEAPRTDSFPNFQKAPIHRNFISEIHFA